MKTDQTVVETLNAFEGLPDEKERYAKVKFASKINDKIEYLSFTQEEVSNLLGITQREVSNLNKGRLSGFTLKQLNFFKNRLGVS